MIRTGGSQRTPAALHVELAARQSSLTRLLDKFETFARTHQLPAAVRRNVHLALDEMASNIVFHGSGGAASCRFSVDIAIDQSAVHIEIADNGRPFDPLRAAKPRMEGSAAERPIGGLGIHLVKALMDSVVYSRRKGRNHLVMRHSIGARQAIARSERTPSKHGTISRRK